MRWRYHWHGQVDYRWKGGKGRFSVSKTGIGMSEFVRADTAMTFL